uniref:Non-specific serine/threonine protein kinase n=1 Tax=Salix viminalis TaxID=40686 RepID=A0A6N2M3S3_SALVM
MCVKTKPCFLLYVLLWLFVYHRTCFSIGVDTISVGQSLSVRQTLVSQTGIFELGFFRPGTWDNIYLGIWHRNFEDKTIVWVANRESPSNDPASSKLELLSDGNLVLLKNFTETIWSTALSSSMPNTTKAEAVILDDGNFVIRDGSNPSTIYWQSFDYPTDTWLPGAKLGINKHTGQVQRLISWKNSEDPAPGMFSVGIDPNGSSQFFIEWNRSHRYWSSGEWNGESFSLIPEMRLNFIFNYSYVSNENESYFTYSLYNTSLLSRLVISVSGQIQQQSWIEGPWTWFLFWSQPKTPGEVYGFCGVFGVFHENSSSYCECLKGFKPLLQNDWSSGCVRKSPLQCQNKKSIGKEDGFLEMSDLALPANSKTYQKVSAGRCRLDCIEKCSCMAYAYNNNNGCSLWEGDLINLQQSGAADGRAGAEIYIRLAASEPELQIGNGSTRTALAVAIPTILITLGLFMYFRCLWKGKLTRKGKEYTGHDILLFDFDTNPGSTNNESSSVDNRKKRWSKNMELPLFSYESVSVATGQFSDKLGEGGFGPVYKGKLPTGLEVAVKRLSERSGQGLEEFRNETILIAKLQHRNLVRLLGSCIERDEKMLIYDFDYPTDTWLPGAKLGINKHTGQVQRLISWKNSEDPAPGMFSVGVDTNGSGQIFMEWNRSHRYWSSGDWNGQIFSLIPEMKWNYVYRYSYVSNENESYFTYSLNNSSYLSRYMIGIHGQLQQLLWMEGPWRWLPFWSEPKDQAGVYGLCGVFGVFHVSSSYCECLKGFKPLVQNDWSSGCVRKSPLQCQNMSSVGKEDGFLKMSNLTLPANSKTYQKVSAGRCRLDCIENCSCMAYAYNNNNGCSLWEGDLINLQQSGTADGRAAAEIYIRLAASEPELQIGKEYTGHDIMFFDFDTNPGSTNKESSSVDNRKKRWSKNMELPLFSYESVSVATGQFSDKLGEGGFGPVYKGKLPTGLEVAVKRLSERSGQGLEEFRNETILIAKLQHRNLVRLLGSCIERDEKMLIYEYMPNKSLDFFLFGENRGQILDWGTRIRIIEGTAQGLLYLHRYSRLRIIHRDLKPSNILLDSEMNPKISDFGMARIFGGNETQGNTKRIVGTYGYMSPEYAMEGVFSVKSDVFSFGVLVLEIVSGRKNTSFYHSDSLHLLGHAWKLWSSNKASDLMDPTLGDPPSPSMLLRYINIGLLCVQESPADRPTMSDVISMIVNEHVALPEPKQPAFVAGRNMADQGRLMSSAGSPSTNNFGQQLLYLQCRILLKQKQ